MNTPVNFELAKLLKEKGINIYSEYRYTDFNGVERLEKDASEIFPYAPTIAEVVMWLYEKYGIWMSVIDNNPEQTKWECQISKKGVGLVYSCAQYPPTYLNSPTEAYEAAIEYVLNNLL